MGYAMSKPNLRAELEKDLQELDYFLFRIFYINFK